MASPIAHAVFGASLWPLFRDPSAPPRMWAWGAALAVLPDIDFVGFQLGVPYDALFGHRGFTHSIVFALAAATAAWYMLRREAAASAGPFAWCFLALAALSHGVFDALTDGGLGVAFFAPLDNTRYFFPFRPIPVSPLSITRFLSWRGVSILLNEMVWVGIPAALLATCGALARRGKRSLPGGQPEAT